jgi:hypothetical protein
VRWSTESASPCPADARSVRRESNVLIVPALSIVAMLITLYDALLFAANLHG